jgi:hypothetical protein
VQRRTLDLLGGVVFLVLAVALLAVGVEFMKNYDFANGNVRDQLSSQKVFFPTADKLTAEEKRQSGVVKYAGQQVDTGQKAHVYANQFIGLHLKTIAGGKTYAQVSEEARANPADQQLATQAQTLFRGETLRGLLLTTYGFWTLGQKAHTAAIWMFIGAGVVFVLGLGGLWHASRAPQPSRKKQSALADAPPTSPKVPAAPPA